MKIDAVKKELNYVISELEMIHGDIEHTHEDEDLAMYREVLETCERRLSGLRNYLGREME